MTDQEALTAEEEEAKAAEFQRRIARNACVSAWQLQAVIDALVAKGLITQDDIDAAAAAAAEAQG